MTLGDSLNKTSFFNIEKYGFWEKKMRIFIEGINHGIWKVAKDCPFVPTDEIMVLW